MTTTQGIEVDMAKSSQSLNEGTGLKAWTHRHLALDSRWNRALAALIALNLAAVVLETVQTLHQSWNVVFTGIEIASVAVFTLEYIARIWSCTESEEYKRPIVGRIKFALTPLALVDLFAIAPFYIPVIVPVDLRFIRSLRLLRIIRVLKLGRYSRAVRLVYRAVHQTRDELSVVLVAVAILLLMACSVMYLFENEAQPDQFSSIPATLWWGVMTLTTVGYGDVYPVTLAGKITAAIVAFLGIGLFALPAGIVTAAFIQIIGEDKPSQVCPHCGGQLD